MPKRVYSFKDLSNQKFGFLQVLNRAPNAMDGKIRWWCRCVCGKEFMVRGAHLTNAKNTLSCGCISRKIQAERAARVFTTHGKSHTLEYKMWASAKTRAKKEGIPFSLVLGDIFIPDVCPVLGIPMHKSETFHSDGSPTLDRIVPSLGYTPGNICVISWRANRIKGDATLEEVEKIAQYIREKQMTGEIQPR